MLCAISLSRGLEALSFRVKMLYTQKQNLAFGIPKAPNRLWKLTLSTAVVGKFKRSLTVDSWLKNLDLIVDDAQWSTSEMRTK